jgi:SAM-dependent methyltransferase
MSQITNGLRAMLSHPIVYTAFQNIMGTSLGYQRLVSEYIRPKPGMRVLDIGCGPAAVLEYLPKVEYYGFDISESYITSAQKRFCKQGHFICGPLTVGTLSSMPTFDLVLGLGLLHHLEDDAAAECFDLAHLALKPGGRFVTIDPCFEDGQNLLARILIKMDRGQNVRKRPEYDALGGRSFKTRTTIVKHSAWIPYTHCIMECTR